MNFSEIGAISNAIVRLLSKTPERYTAICGSVVLRIILSSRKL